jgi:hypothetical protein
MIPYTPVTNKGFPFDRGFIKKGKDSERMQRDQIYLYIGITLALQRSIITGIYTDGIPMYPQTIPPYMTGIVF